MRRIRDLPDLDRPREKLARRGAQALSDVELLAILLGSGSKGQSALAVASSILTRAGPSLDRLTVDDLQAVAGVGVAKACAVVAALELARRHLMGRRHVISRPHDALPYLQHLADKQQEYFACLSLSGAHEVIQSRVITVGLLNSTQVHPREVFADAITDRAAAIVVAHNHPSGNLEPSSDDLRLTRQLVEAGEILGIEVLDHLIITKRGYTSLKEGGYL
ncbi:MAG: RadC family protein [Candidatus Bipolaricaulaceae bacterium]